MVIETLTPEQYELAEKITKEWITIGNTPKPIVVEEIQDSVNEMYKLAKLDKPLVFVCDDPFEMEIAANLFMYFDFDLLGKINSKRPLYPNHTFQDNNIKNKSKTDGTDENLKLENKMINAYLTEQTDDNLYAHPVTASYLTCSTGLRDKLDRLIRNPIETSNNLQIFAVMKQSITGAYTHEREVQAIRTVYGKIVEFVRTNSENQAFSNEVFKAENDIDGFIDNNNGLVEFEKFGGMAWRSGFLAKFEFYQKLGLFKLKNHEEKLFKDFTGIVKSGVWDMVFLPAVCIVCSCPKAKRDDDNRLHSITSKAVEFNSGYGEYVLHGTWFTDNVDLFKKITKRELSAKEILGIENIEFRNAAIRHYGLDAVFGELDTTLIDKSDRGNELYSVKDIHPDRPVLYLKYNDISPTGRVFVKGVPDKDDSGAEIKTADHAQAWSHNMTLEEYQDMEVES